MQVQWYSVLRSLPLSMCGIFGYIGYRENAAELTVDGLKNLEYRGYDSWGICLRSDHGLKVFKDVGRISLVNDETMYINACSTAIGHSRWATHGGVTKKNAHPHLSNDQSVVVVHNGIIENFASIKKELIAEGYHFESETDTEVIPNLIQYYLKNHSFFDAVFLALERLDGRYAVCIMSTQENSIIAARRGSPLIVGKGKNEMFLASDIPAFLDYTRTVNYLDDDQMVYIERNQTRYFDILTRTEVTKRDIEITWDKEESEKGDYPHFMIKEIMEQKDSIARAINQKSEHIDIIREAISEAYGTYLVGCGTAGKVCLAASYAFAHIAKHHVNFTFGSEFPHLDMFVKPESLLIAVSQSGETADTLEAIHSAKAKGAKILSILNVEGSTMSRESHFTLYLKSGPEKSVASTKATTAQLAVLLLIAYALDNRLDEGERLLIETSAQINELLNPRYEEHILSIARDIQHVESMYVIGRGINYPMAQEAAIKLQEVSYIHAEGFAGGELKHGPIALISEGTPVIVLVANDECKAEILSNAMEVKARGARVIGISPTEEDVFDDWIRVPDCGEASAIVNIIPVQMMAYHLAVLRNNDPDKPRNLAKSVTVK